MPLFVKARSFLRNLYAHLELLIAKNIRAGKSPEEAQRVARIELGGVEQLGTPAWGH